MLSGYNWSLALPDFSNFNNSSPIHMTATNKGLRCGLVIKIRVRGNTGDDVHILGVGKVMNVSYKQLLRKEMIWEIKN